MKLATFQNQLQAAILSQSCDVLGDIEDTPAFIRFERLKIYVNAYRLRHAAFIAKDYPVLREVMGDEDFENLALGFIDAHPSREVNARWYAHQLPNFMTTLSGLEFEFADLARLERALGDAFDAPDAQVASPTSILSFGPERAHLMSFRFHPSVNLMTLRNGTRDLYLAAADETELPVLGDGVESIAVWRRELTCFHRKLDHNEAQALRLAMTGAAFGAICRTFDSSVDATEAGTWLLQWLGDGLLTRIFAA
jgi:hypothetical protein